MKKMSANEIVKSFIKGMKKNADVTYVRNDEDWGVGNRVMNCQGVDARRLGYVAKEGGVFLMLEQDYMVDEPELLFISMDNGEIYREWNGEVVGKMNKNAVKTLLPIYKKYYLDDAQRYLKERTHFVGVRDDFSVMAKKKGVLTWELAELPYDVSPIEDTKGFVRFFKGSRKEFCNRIYG